MDTESTAGLEWASWRGKASKFISNNCVSRDVLEERGAGEVGWKQPHEQESDSTGQGQARQSKGKLENESRVKSWPVRRLIW